MHGERVPQPSEITPKGDTQLLAGRTTPGHLHRFATLVLQQRGQQSALGKGRFFFSERYEFHKRLFSLRLTAPNPRGTRNHLHEPLSTVASLQVTRGSR
jgi:hypothetical protein